MPRTPNHKAKTLRLVLIPKNGQETKIRAFKELIARNGLSISDILYEKVEQFLKEHNWPPGNSQTLLELFQERSPHLTCFKCREDFRFLTKVEFISGKIAQVCDGCLQDYEERRLIKKRVKRNY